MEYCFVDKNFLVPEIQKFNKKNDALNYLYKSTIKRNQDYNNEVYVIEIINGTYNGYYFLENDIIKMKNISNQTITIPFDTNKFTININGKNLKNNYIFSTNNILNNNININDSSSQMQLVINENKNTNIKIKEEKEENIILPKEENILSEEEIKKKDALLKMCEEVMEEYQSELRKIKVIENNLKSLDTKINKLNRKKEEEQINKMTITQCEYRTWKQIKYDIIEDNDVYKDFDELKLKDGENIIPIMFSSKYQYIDNLVKNENVKKIFEYINNMNLEELFTNEEYKIDNNIINMAEKYVSYSKKLHYKFEHEWDYLENEMNISSTNSL
jgi:hypothetical protein